MKVVCYAASTTKDSSDGTFVPRTQMPWMQGKQHRVKMVFHTLWCFIPFGYSSETSHVCLITT